MKRWAMYVLYSSEQRLSSRLPGLLVRTGLLWLWKHRHEVNGETGVKVKRASKEQLEQEQTLERLEQEHLAIEDN